MRFMNGVKSETMMNANDTRSLLVSQRTFGVLLNWRSH